MMAKNTVSLLFVCTLLVSFFGQHWTSPVKSTNDELASQTTSESLNENGLVSETESTLNALHGKASDRKCALLKNPYLSDVDLIIKSESLSESQIVIPAHKLLLIYHSSVFETALTKSTELRQSFIVHDISADILDIMLRYMYCNENHVQRKDLLNLLLASKKFELSELIEITVNELIKNLNSDNALHIYEQVQGLGVDELVNGIANFLQYNENHLFNEDNIETWNRSSMQFVLSQPRLGVPEWKLFEFAVHWATVQIKKEADQEITPQKLKDTLGELLYMLRIPLMTTEDLMRGPAKSGLFSNENIIEFIDFQVSKDHEKTELVSQFNLEPRVLPNLIPVDVVPHFSFHNRHSPRRGHNSFAIKFLSSFNFCMAGFKLKTKHRLSFTVNVIKGDLELHSAAFDLNDLEFDGKGYNIRFAECLSITNEKYTEIFIHFDKTYYDQFEEPRQFTNFFKLENFTYTVTHLFKEFYIQNINVYKEF